MRSDDPKLSKLPKWAQDEIRMLRRNEKSANDRLREQFEIVQVAGVLGDLPAGTFEVVDYTLNPLSEGREKRMVLPRLQHVRLWLPGGKSVELLNRGKDDSYRASRSGIEIRTGSGSLLLSPFSTNVVGIDVY